MPLVYITSTAAPGYTHEPYEVRVDAMVYTVVTNSTADVPSLPLNRLQT